MFLDPEGREFTNWHFRAVVDATIGIDFRVWHVAFGPWCVAGAGLYAGCGFHVGADL